MSRRPDTRLGVGRIAVPAALIMVLTACLSPGGENRPLRTYQLSLDPAAAPPPGTSGKPGSAILLVTMPQPQAGFDTPGMVYLRRPHEVNYYATSQWADTPARMLASLLVQALEQSHAWQAVVHAPTPLRADYRVDSDTLLIEHEFFQQPSRVRLTLRVQLIELRGQRILGTRLFEALEEAPSEDAYGGVVAANQAVTKLLADVAAWLSTRLNEAEPRGK